MKYDSIIIGFGKGGKTLAGALAKAGEKVALIEKSKMMYGGTCINVGCIPSKSLITSAEGARKADDKAAYYKAAINKKRELTSKLREKNFDKLNSLDNVDIINGEAKFISNNEIIVNGEALFGEKIFINTGGTPVVPNLPGIESLDKIYFSEDLMDEENLPNNLLIVGGGYIGLEFAAMYSDFGAKVTVVQDGDVLLPREDEDLVETIVNTLQEKGVTFKLGTNVNLKEVSKEYDGILIATGRKPNTEGLGLENTDVKLTNRGAVVTDDNLKTDAPNIWAIGDVTGGLQFTYTSLDDYRVVLSALKDNGKYTKSDRKNVPYSVFLAPTFSRVGINEKEAKAAGIDYRVLKMPAAAIPKALVLESPQGLLKAIVDNNTNKILGAMLYCKDSHEMINLVKLAMDMEVDYKVLRDMVFTHPTMSEALNDLFSL
ncbi:MAG: FAD-dependent oxidoreductase [Anaerovoracaceae bacterium]